MNKDLHIDSLLDSWLQGNLPDDEAAEELGKAGISNPQVELQRHRAARVAIIRWSARQDVEAIHQEFMANKSVMLPSTFIGRKKGISLWLKIAASFLILLSITGGIVYWQTSSKKLYQQLNLAYELNTPRSAGGTSIPELLQEFQAKDYKQVVDTYSSLPEPDNRARFLAGYSWLQLSEPAKAEQLFQSIIDRNSAEARSLYQDEAEYYLGLAFLRQKKNPEARFWFTKIANDPQHTYHSQLSRWVRIRLGWLK